MAVAFSLSPIQFNQAIDGSSVGSLVSGLLSTLNDAGWVGSGITGGFKFTLVSPQNMQCKVKVWDDSSGNAAIQFLSVDEARIGFLHHLAPASGLVFQCWANVCQLFVSVAGKYIADPFKGPWFACGGIPFVPSGLLGSCGVDAGPTLANEIWWSCGDGSGTRAGVDSLSFRLSNAPTGYSACYNGDLQNAIATGPGSTQQYSALNSFRLLPMGVCLPWPNYFGATLDPRLYRVVTAVRGQAALPLRSAAGLGLRRRIRWRGAAERPDLGLLHGKRIRAGR